MGKKKRKIRPVFKGILIAILVVAIGFCGFAGYNFFKNHVGNDSNEETSVLLESSTPEATVEPTTTSASLFMIGDSLLHTTIEADAANGDGTYNFTLLDRVGAIAQNYDLKYYNQETILGGDDLGIHGYPTFNGPTAWGDYMTGMGFNLVSTANNHSLDQGTYGITNSVNYWKSKENVVMSGTYTSQEDYDAIPIHEVNGISYAFISYTYGMNGFENPSDMPYAVACYAGKEGELLNKISTANEQADVVIVAIHWGNEYQLSPSDEQKQLAQQMADAGADIIIGNHPHCIEPVQWLNDGKVICFYALGNCCAAQYELSRIEMMGAITINKTTNSDGSVDISLSDLKTDLMYCYTNGENWSNFDVVPFFQMSDDTYVSNHEAVYEEYKAVITSLDSSIPVGGFN